MKKLFILSILIVTTFYSFAFKPNGWQITGAIEDDKGLPLFNATVMLLLAKDSSLIKGDLSNDKGYFEFSDIEKGSYIISTSNIGYKKYYSSVVQIDETNKSAALNIKLLLADKSMKEVKVFGKKPLIEVKADKTVFNVEQSINAAGSNALDLLRKSPGVRVDKDENIQMRGKNNVLIYIDGKPTYLSTQDLTSLLKSMQASDIESIELITNPSAKYDASGNAGIINIKLKKNKKIGTNGTINAGLAHGKYFQHNESINLNYRNKKINIFGSYAFNANKYINIQNLNRIQNASRYDMNATNTNEDKANAIRIGTDYYMNSKNVFGVMANINMTDGGFTSTSKTRIGPEIGPVDKLLIASNKIPSSRVNATYNANYKYEDTLGRALSIDLDYGNFKSKGRSYQPNTYWNAEETTVLTQSIFKNYTPTFINIYAIKSDYEQNLLKGKLGIGIKSALVKTDNDFQFYDVVNDVDTLNLQRTNHFVYTENVNAAYINYARNFTQKWSTQFGLRAEQTNSSGVLSSAQNQADDKVKRHYLNLFPSAGFSYNANAKHSFGLTYSRRIDRPNYQDLNPFENKLDELTYEKGNAFLRPQYTDAVDLSHTFMQFMTTTLSYSHTKDIYMQTTDTTELSRTFVTQKNFASQDLLGFNIGSPIPIKKWWMVYANLNGTYTMLKANFEGRKLQNNYFTYVFYADNTITLPKDFSLNLSGWYSSYSYWGGTFKTKPMGSLDIGIQKLFLQKRLTAKLSLSDVFKSQVWYATSNFGGLYMNGNGYADSRQLRLNLSYRFGSNQIAQQRERKSGAANESGRIKAK